MFMGSPPRICADFCFWEKERKRKRLNTENTESTEDTEKRGRKVSGEAGRRGGCVCR